MRTREKIAWSLLAALGLAVVASVASVALGGPLDPPGPIGPSMKTLDDIPGSWSRSLDSTNGIPSGENAGCDSSRFKCVLLSNGGNLDGVLDLETGLVWERHVNSASVFNWGGSQCTLTEKGDVQGWRLPTVFELNSLLDFAAAGPPLLPPGHPFSNVHATDPYWTSTRDDDETARTFSFDGGVGVASIAAGQARNWCVRGPE